MKKYFTLLLCVFPLLVSCAIPNQNENSGSSNNRDCTVPDVSYELNITQNIFALDHMCTNVPTSYKGEIIYSDARFTWDDPAAKKTGMIDIETGQMVYLDVYLFDPRMDDTYLYGMDVDLQSRAAKTIVRIARGSKEKEVIYTIKEGNTFMLRLAYDSGHLFWLEDLGSDPIMWEVHYLNTETLESGVLRETNYAFGVYPLPDARYGYLPIVYFENGYQVEVYDIGTKEVVYTYTLPHEPLKIYYNGEYLIWTKTPSSGGDKVVLHQIQDKTTTELEDTEGTAEALLYHNYVVYVQEEHVYIREISSGDMVFSTKSQELSENKSILMYFFFDPSTGYATFSNIHHPTSTLLVLKLERVAVE